MRRALSVAVFGLLALSACDKALTESNGPLTGTWTYRATGFQPSPVDSTYTCDLQATYVFRQEGHHIEGIAQGSFSACRTRGGRSLGGGPAVDGVVRGEVREGRIYITNAGNWHSFGEVQGDRIEGYLETYGGYSNEPSRTVRSGRFEMIKTSNEGYHGPPA